MQCLKRWSTEPEIDVLHSTTKEIIKIDIAAAKERPLLKKKNQADILVKDQGGIHNVLPTALLRRKSKRFEKFPVEQLHASLSQIIYGLLEIEVYNFIILSTGHTAWGFGELDFSHFKGTLVPYPSSFLVLITLHTQKKAQFISGIYSKERLFRTEH